MSGAVALCVTVELSDDEKLEVLGRLDQFRQWHSLDEKRYCLVCGNLISGRQIQVADGTRGNRPLRLSCPTERCNSIPMDWVLPTNEILAKMERLKEEQGPGPNAGSHNDCQWPNSASRQEPRAFRVAITQAGVSFEATF